MKLQICIIAALALSLVSAEVPFTTFKDSDDLFNVITRGDHRVYILFLYDSVWTVNPDKNFLANYVEEERHKLQHVAGKHGDKVLLAEIDIRKGDFNYAL